MSFVRHPYEKNPTSGLSKGGFILGAISVTFVILAFSFLMVHFFRELQSEFEWASLGLLLSAILIGLIALFVGVNGYKQAKKWEERGKGLGLAGFIMGIVAITLSLFTA